MFPSANIYFFRKKSNFSIFSDLSRNSRAARHLPCAVTNPPNRLHFTPLKKVRSIVNPTTRYRRLCKNERSGSPIPISFKNHKSPSGYYPQAFRTNWRPETQNRVQLILSVDSRPLLCISFSCFQRFKFSNPEQNRPRNSPWLPKW